jgi:cytochrome P450
MAEIKKDYLKEYDNVSDAEKFPLVKKWMDTEPLPFFKQLREQRPILVTPLCTLVSLFNDVRDVLLMPKIFTVALYKSKMGDYLMTHDDDAVHDREKGIMQAMLNRNDVPAIRQMIAKNAHQILDAAHGRIEACYDYCRSVPASLVQDYAGFDHVERKDLIEWSYWTQYDSFHNQFFCLYSKEKTEYFSNKKEAMGKKFGAYMAGLIIRKSIAVKAEKAVGFFLCAWIALVKLAHRIMGSDKYELKDTIITRMLQASYPDALEFPIDRLGLNAGGLLIGTIETTSQAVAQVIQMILKDPNLFKRAREAAQKENPDEFDGYVWEALRFVPIAPFLFRQTASPFTLGKGTPHETTIPHGTNVLALTQSAMCDTYAFENPETFNPKRTWYNHFNFGFGSHECLGKYIGMVMIPEMVRQIVLLPNIKAESDIDYKGGPFPEAYPLSWG